MESSNFVNAIKVTINQVHSTHHRLHAESGEYHVGIAEDEVRVGDQTVADTVASREEAVSSEPPAIEQKQSGPPPVTMPFIWEMFGFLLSRETRERVFEPAYNDLLADYLATRDVKYQGQWTQRWLSCCFSWRLIGLFLESVQVGLQTGAVKLLLRLISPIGDAVKFLIGR